VLLRLATKDTVRGATDISVDLRTLLICGGLFNAETTCRHNAASQVKKRLATINIVHHLPRLMGGRSVVIAETKDTVRDNSDISVDLRSLHVGRGSFFASEFCAYADVSEIKNTCRNHPISPLKLFWKEGPLHQMAKRRKSEVTP
jgi:hypothetical protein